MSQDLTISKSIKIISTPQQVWEILTSPVSISQYIPGAQLKTTWAIGTPVIFTHFYNGATFENKGIVLNFEPHHLLKYSYWTAFSNTEDRPENYTIITYTIAAIGNQTNLTLTQTNCKNAAWYQALEQGWDTVLNTIKELSEKQLPA